MRHLGGLVLCRSARNNDPDKVPSDPRYSVILVWHSKKVIIKIFAGALGKKKG